MKIKRIITSAICAALLLTSVVSVSAVEKISTPTIKMGGFNLYGSLTLYSLNATGYTYSERPTAGKSAQTYYAYNNNIGGKYCVIGGSDGYTYNNKTGLSVSTKNANTDYFVSYAGAKTLSKVIYPEATYYHWTSEGSDNELRMGWYKNNE